MLYYQVHMHYSKINKVVLYINEILSLRCTLEYDKNCSAMVSTFPPFNSIATIFAPYIVITQRSEKINNYLFHLEYIPFLVLITPVYFVLNIVLIPFGYIKGNLLNLKQICKKKMEVSIKYRIFRLFVFLFFGIFILLLNLCADLVVFILHCYQQKLSYRKVETKVLKVSKESYEFIYNKAKRELKSQVKIVSPKTLAIYVRGKMNIMKHIQALIFGQTMNGNYESSQTILNRINEYILVKKVFQSVSLPDGIYIENLISVMEELKMSSKIRELIFVEDGIITSARTANPEQDSHLRRFFYVNFALVYETLIDLSSQSVDLISIKKVIVNSLFAC